MDLHLSDKSAVVTGASKGIGLAIFRSLVNLRGEGEGVRNVGAHAIPVLEGRAWCAAQRSHRLSAWAEKPDVARGWAWLPMAASELTTGVDAGMAANPTLACRREM